MKNLLDKTYRSYATSDFIQNDPISIPHRFSLKQDIEIAGFFAAIFSWGRRDIIISKSNELMDIMENNPYSFISNYRPKPYHFKHRTFNASDLDFYFRALKTHYQNFESLESAFIIENGSDTIEENLISFYRYFSEIVPSERRNLKHISTPKKNSACKRLCMFLRWMVRKDGIDFGIWHRIKPSQLIIPLDVHVLRVALNLGLLEASDKANWHTAVKLTEKLKQFHKKDPVRYDYSLFGMGVRNLPSSLI